MENIKTKPADLIIRKYVLTGTSRVRVTKNSQLYDKIFERYSDKEQEQIIQDYMEFKSNKVYPSIPDLKKFIATHYSTNYKTQKTNRSKKPFSMFIDRVEQEEFNGICRKAHIDGIIYIPYCQEQGLKFGNRNILRDGKLWDKYYDWDDAIDRAKKMNPSFFEKYPHANYLEQATIAWMSGQRW